MRNTRALSRIVSATSLAAGLLASCAPPTTSTAPTLSPLPALRDAATTRAQSLVPLHAPLASDLNPSIPANLALYLDNDVGALAVGGGEPLVMRTVDGSEPPARGAHPRRLARFIHLSDIQLMDDESPGRAADVDSPQVNSALRPQDPLMCRMLNAAVRTINALNANDPVDFVLLGGDNADSAQENEVRWVMQILDGSSDVHCDSGADDDIDPAGDDGKDHFAAAGLDVPWHWVSGNHDVTVQGNFSVDDAQKQIALGKNARLGTRVYSGGGFGAIADGDVVIPDAARALLDGPALLDLVGGDGDGHGLATSSGVDHGAGKAFHAFDLEGTPLTFVVLDTAHRAGGAEGVITQRDVDALIGPALDDAKARNRVVVLASHHAVDSLSADGGIFGHTEDDALLPDAWRAKLAEYPNVLFSMVGHSHRNHVTLQHAAVPPAQPQSGESPAPHAFWEVTTSALADWPHEFRIVEIWDDDNGTLRLETSPVDYVADDDAPAALGRAMGLIDMLSGWNGDGFGTPDDRNVALLVSKPSGI